MVISSVGSHEDRVLLAKTAPEQHEHSTGETVEKGCFCCCANFIPDHSVFTGIISTEVTAIAPAPLGLSVSPPEDTFHPPRLS
ncbi:MAG TPA: hypothetical protein VJ302_34150 [Blastocatellia bacterium]|nr:hypothetical protein [Blastocatellia bacterium]